jgi:hypothetical protein
MITSLNVTQLVFSHKFWQKRVSQNRPQDSDFARAVSIFSSAVFLAVTVQLFLIFVTQLASILSAGKVQGPFTQSDR